MKKSLWIAALIAALVVALSACEKPDEPDTPDKPDTPVTPSKKDADMRGVVFESETVVYDGKTHTLSIGGLPDGITAKLTCLKDGKEVAAATDAGVYTFRADFSADEAYNCPQSMTATLTIGKAKIDTSGVLFADSVIDFDGEGHTLEAQNLPAGVAVSYNMTADGNTVREARTPGHYTVTAVFTVPENYEEIPPMTAILTINPAQADMSGVVFEGATVVYDGEAHTLTAKDLPAGVEATYSYSLGGQDCAEAKDAGVYTVTAHFTVPEGFNEIPPYSAILTVEKAAISLDGLTFADGFFLYDGEAHSLAVEGELPEGISGFTYTSNDKKKVGIYTVKAVPTVDGNHKADSMEAKMTVFGVTAKIAIADNSGNSLSRLDVTVADGVSYTLTATPDFVFDGATYTYKWYKNTKGYMRNEHGDSIGVSKLVDGGKYTCQITVTLGEQAFTGECSTVVVIRNENGCYLDETGSLILPMDTFKD